MDYSQNHTPIQSAINKENNETVHSQVNNYINKLWSKANEQNASKDIVDALNLFQEMGFWLENNSNANTIEIAEEGNRLVENFLKRGAYAEISSEYKVAFSQITGAKNPPE